MEFFIISVILTPRFRKILFAHFNNIRVLKADWRVIYFKEETQAQNEMPRHVSWKWRANLWFEKRNLRRISRPKRDGNDKWRRLHMRNFIVCIVHLI